MQHPDTNRWGRFGAGSFLRRLSSVLCATAIIFNATATNHILRQDEIMVGLNGDPAVQFIKITVSDGTQKAWGPGPGELSSRAMLVFFNTAGLETGRFLFPNNAPIGANTVLIATTNFAAVPGAPIPDFIMPPLLNPAGGKVCFRGNPANPRAFGVNLCLSYGPISPDLTEGGGPPAPLPPATGEPVSLARFRNFGFGGVNQNSDFAMASPSPANTRGQTVVFSIPGPEIDFIPTNVNFGPRDMTQGPSAPLSLTITNRGFANSLNISNVSLIPNQGLFAIVSDSGQTTLPPGGTRTINLTFDPDSPGLKTAVLRVVSNDENENISSIQLRGLGVDPNAPEVDVAPTSLSFLDQDIAAGPTPLLQLTVRNVGTVGSLSITSIQLAGSHGSQFRVISGVTNAGLLPPGASRVLFLAFDPTSAGLKSASLRIISSDTDESVLDVPLVGRAFDLNPCTAPNPTNSVAQNHSTNAQVIGPGLIFTGTTLLGTPDGSSSCGTPGVPDVWFRYVPAADGSATMTVIGTSFLPTVSVHTAPTGTQTELACDSGVQSQSITARVTVNVTNGLPVFIRVAGTSPSFGSFQLSMEGPPVFNFDRNENGVTDSCEFDFGDAPTPYPTTLAQNGARHRRVGIFSLGRLVDSNDDGQPSPAAAGDNEDGPRNDEDGIAFVTPMIPGQTASVFVTGTTANARLNAWVDFNADGDWSDAGEQIFTNVFNVGGTIFSNPLNFSVPVNATVTNRTFARFRLSSQAGLTFTGEAPDGEVEDYLVEILPPNPVPGQLGVRINEVMAGVNGDSSAQFVELEVENDASRVWGPQGGETTGRAMLLFYDQAGRQTGRFVFPSNAPPGASTVLIATRAFAEQAGLAPDFIMPPEVVAIAGKVAFASNPDNRHFDIHVALSYGGNGYHGATDGAGPANARELPVLHIASLQRTQNVPFGLNRNSAFERLTATPRNTAGSTVALLAKSFAQQGEILFMRETFRGNGRTCATCHVPGRDQFGLTPLTIASLPEKDPLFVFEHNVNLLRLSVRSQPSDLRGEITGAAGTAKILSGSGDTYLIIGGTNLSGAITDTNGNGGTFLSLAKGDLDGPTPSNGSERGLEAHNFLEHGRGLILENIDNFKHLEVFRASPHLLNLNLTGPFGLSGEFDSLDMFSDGAVVQHFPKSLTRVAGVDFRHPTDEELAAMSAFMFGLSPADTNRFNLDRFATTEAQKRGRELFFGDQGRCSKCHSGPVLAQSDGTLPDSVAGVNENFNTGVANLLRNILDAMPTEPAGLEPGQSTRKFNTPPLFNIRLTAPFFHDGSAETLTDAVKFYDKEEFHNSPAGDDVGSLLAANKPELVADLVAFLESLVDLPVGFMQTADFGVHCPGSPIPGPLAVVITNLSAHTISITNVVINGTNAAAFAMVGASGASNLASRGTLTILVAFAPTNFGLQQATLEFTGVDTNLLGVFSFGVGLRGADIDALVQANVTALNFGSRDISSPPSPLMSIVITNNSSTPLDMSRLELSGTNISDFPSFLSFDPIPPHNIGIIEIAFDPIRAGTKSATLRLPVLACNTSLLEIPLAGTGISTVRRFVWEPFPGTQFVGRPFPVKITAVDENDDTVEAFTGRVTFNATGGLPSAPQITPERSGPFVSGVWTGLITMLQPSLVVIEAGDAQGHQGSTAPFLVLEPDDLSLTVLGSPNPNPSGQIMTYHVGVANSGPGTSTGVVVTNRLSSGVSFLNAITSQGSITHSDGLVIAQLGALPGGAVATVSIQVEPNTGATNLVNIATASRNEPEQNLANNTATNVASVGQFGILVVQPLTNFLASGFSGGPFTPTNQVYALSNAGSAALSWQIRASDCSLPEGIAAWWPLDGNASDQFGTNNGILSGNVRFTNGLVSQAMEFDGIDDAVRFPASSNLNLGVKDGLTLEAWVLVTNLNRRGPVFEWNDGTVNVGTHFWVSLPAAGGLFANLSDINNNSHNISTPGGLLRPNEWQHIALTYSKISGLAKIYLNGTNVAQQNLGSFTPRTGIDFWLGRRASAGFLESYLGLIDEPSVYGRELSSNEIQAIVNSGALGKCSRDSLSGGTNTNCVLPPGVVSWWSLNGDNFDNVGTNRGTLQGNPAFTNGLAGTSLAFDGNDDGFRIPVSPELNLGTNNGFSFETWFNVPIAGRRGVLFSFDDASNFSGPLLMISITGPASFQANLVDTANGIHVLNTANNLFTPNAWHHAALTYNRVSGLTTIYLNGAPIAQQNLGTFTAKTLGSVSLGRRTVSGAEESLLGSLDEPAFYNRELTTNEIRAIFESGAGGKCRTPSWVRIPAQSGILLPGASTNVSLSINTNAAALPVGRHFETFAFVNITSGRGSTDRTAILSVLNRPPTLAALSSIQLAEDSGQRSITLSGIGAGGSEQQQLSVTASSSNPGLIANPITVNYTSPAATGNLVLAPLTNTHGTAIVSVVLRDDAGTAGGGADAVTNTFLVTVTPVNDPPTLATPPDQVINEGFTLTLTNSASDPDLPADILVFTLIAGPPGSAVDPSTGVFTWTPTEAQGPGTNLILIAVGDGGAPTLRATNQFGIRVNEVNLAPALASIADRIVHEGMLVSWTAPAFDSDLPANQLTYLLGTGVPTGAGIHPATGAFNWVATGVPVPSTNLITYTVSDNGSPVLTDTKNCRIIVVSAPRILEVNRAGSNVTLVWSSVAGLAYQVQFKNSLSQANWSPLPNNVTATDSTALKIDVLPSSEQRFYRIEVVQ